ncbi:MAG: hypothetical protein CMN77_03015 [Spirochaetaceae bacterium]|nr:hypothetical protein [Spirochaetaceae bacterium]|tara:strand:- start:25129 stop:27081 length:1953 start_codon:yes stop_codon:yes gene_type:complete
MSRKTESYTPRSFSGAQSFGVRARFRFWPGRILASVIIISLFSLKVDGAPVGEKSSIAVHSLTVEGGADLAYLGLDASGQPIYATVSYADGNLQYYTVASDGLQGEGMRIDYYQGKDLGKRIVSETRSSINMPIGNGSPHEQVPRDDFSLRAYGVLKVNRSGTYTFITRSDDGVRLYINGRRIIDEWRGMGTTEFRSSVNLVAGQSYKIQLDYFEQGGPGHLELLWQRPGSETPSHLSKTGTLSSTALLVREEEGIQESWQAEYFKGRNFEQSKLKRSEAFIDHDFNKSSAAPSVPRENFSARWTGRLKIKTPGEYTFYTTSDDGVRLYINGQLIIDEWRGMAPTEHSGTVQLQSDADVLLEYFQGGGGASIQLEWQGPDSSRRMLGPAGGFRAINLEAPPFSRRVFSVKPSNGDLSRNRPLSLAVLAGGIQSDITMLEIAPDGSVRRTGPISGPSEMQASLHTSGLIFFDGEDIRIQPLSGAQAGQSVPDRVILSEIPVSICSSGSIITHQDIVTADANLNSVKRHSLEDILRSGDSDEQSGPVAAACSVNKFWVMTGDSFYSLTFSGQKWSSQVVELPPEILQAQFGNLRGLQILSDGPPMFAYGKYVFRWKGKLEILFEGQGELSCVSGPQMVCLDSDAGRIWQLRL